MCEHVYEHPHSHHMLHFDLLVLDSMCIESMDSIVTIGKLIQSVKQQAKSNEEEEENDEKDDERGTTGRSSNTKSFGSPM